MKLYTNIYSISQIGQTPCGFQVPELGDFYVGFDFTRDGIDLGQYLTTDDVELTDGTNTYSAVDKLGNFIIFKLTASGPQYKKYKVIVDRDEPESESESIDEDDPGAISFTGDVVLNYSGYGGKSFDYEKTPSIVTVTETEWSTLTPEEGVYYCVIADPELGA